MTKVAAAITLQGEVILIAQRADGQRLAGKWEFPGGKVRCGETLEECLKREIKEELGITIEVENFFAENSYQYDKETIRLLAFTARWVDGAFSLTAHSQIQWVRREELGNFDFAPADIPFIKKLKEEHL